MDLFGFQITAKTVAMAIGMLALLALVAVILFNFLRTALWVFRERWWLIAPVSTAVGYYLYTYHDYTKRIIFPAYSFSVGTAVIAWSFGVWAIGTAIWRKYRGIVSGPEYFDSLIYDGHIYRVVENQVQNERASDRTVFESEATPRLNYQEAVALVSSLEHRRVGLGQPAGWLDLQCMGEAELLQALYDLRKLGLIADPFNESQQQQRQERPVPEKERSAPFDPYKVLKVTRDATPEQLRTAYREQMKLYHPDRTSHLGEELRALAEEMTKTIQKAYEMVRVDK